MYGTSDKSSSSDKKFKVKNSQSSNSSGIKDLHAGTNSGNSSSEKSDQRNLENLAKRNNIPIQDIYKYEPSSESKSHIARGDNSEHKNFENSQGAMHLQESNSKEYNIESESTPEVYIKMRHMSTFSKSAKKEGSKLMDSQESVFTLSSKKPESPKVYDGTGDDNFEHNLVKKTPEKVPYDQVSKSEDGKGDSPKDDTSKCPSSNMTPFKSLETITEQATHLEVDNTHDWKSDQTSEKFCSPVQSIQKTKSPCKFSIIL